jgi:uncharacterized protein with FMN-binding domain
MAKRRRRRSPAPRGSPKPTASVSVKKATRFGTARKGKLSSGIIAMSTAAIVAVYALGRSNTSAVSGQLTADPSSAAASIPGVQDAGAGSASSLSNVTYKDGTYTGSGNSRHGGMRVAVVIKDGKIVSANVASCSTRYPCSDVNPLIRAAISKQGVPASHVSGATDSSQAYRQALTNALKQAKA